MAKRLCFILFVFFGAAAAQAQDWQVLFSANGGFYDDVFELEMFSTHPHGHIRFTTNGNRPTAQSPIYETPLLLDERLYSQSDIYTINNTIPSLFYLPDSIRHCIVIRAAVFDDDGNRIGEVSTQSYFIRALGCDTHGLPAVSICADSLDLFGYENGIMVPGRMFDPLNPDQTGNYYMKGREWERHANIEFREVADNSGINQACGLRTHGNRARQQPQKGLKVYAREEYGKKRFRHPFFEANPTDGFKHLLIKPFSSLYPYSGVQDYVCSQMAIGIGLEAGRSRPVVVYLNGEYWGVYFLQEKMDERYLEDHYGIDIGQCNIISNWMELENGHDDSFQEMMDWLETADLSMEENYRHANEIVDVDNFIDYMILETFVDNYDWPANNSRCWQMEGGKWRWMFFDGDAAFGNINIDPFGNPVGMDVFGNATYTGPYNWPSSERATLLFRKLLENTEFCRLFDARLHELCQSGFLYENTAPILTRVVDWLRPEMEPQSFRFGIPTSVSHWEWGWTLSDDFLRHRVETYLAEWESYTAHLPEPVAASVVCYPNPTSGELHIRFLPELSGSDEIVLYDIMGRKVFSQLFQSNGNPVEAVIHPNLSPGVYVLKTGDFTQRVVKY